MEIPRDRGSRSKLARLEEKLLQIRIVLGESQDLMVRPLGLDEVPGWHYMSGYELGTREPSFATLLRYAELVNVWFDVLARDDLDLLPLP